MNNWKCLVLLVVFGCSASASDGPVCDPHGVGVVVIVAPADIEIPECTEEPVEEPELNVGRREWCCWKDSAPSLDELDRRRGAQ